MKNFYGSLKDIYGPTSAGSSPLPSSDGTKLISEKNEILKRLAELFDGLLNRLYSINDKAIKLLPQISTQGVDQITIRQLSSGKAPGSESIPAEIYEEGGSVLMSKLHLNYMNIL